MAAGSKLPAAAWQAAAGWYDQNAESFAAASLGIDTSLTRTRFLSGLPRGARVLDAGCGAGRDTLAFAEHGYRAGAFDASAAMVAATRSLTANLATPVDVRRISFTEFSDPPGSWDAIWCMAALLHLPREALPDAARRLITALAPAGRIFVSVKAGEGEALDARGRPFSYLGTLALAAVLEGAAQAATRRIANMEAWSEMAPGSGGEVTTWSNAILHLDPKGR